MLKKSTVKIIEETIEQMTIQNGGELSIEDNFDEIARRAEISKEVLEEYFKEIFFNRFA